MGESVFERVKLPFPENVVLGAARGYFGLNSRADLEDVVRVMREHENPKRLFDDFSDPNTVYGREKWHVTLINGSGKVRRAPHGEAANILVEEDLLKLQVKNDPKLSEKSRKWSKDIAACEAYNNAYVVGMSGFMPTQKEEVLFSFRAKVSEGFSGSTLGWMQEKDTFDPETGIMQKPFRSFGFSFAGEDSVDYIKGLTMGTYLNLSFQKTKKVVGINPHIWHDYQMRWGWKSEKLQYVEFGIDGKILGTLDMYPFGIGEVHLWADNFWVRKFLNLDYANPKKIDETQYEWVRIETVVVK